MNTKVTLVLVSLAALAAADRRPVYSYSQESSESVEYSSESTEAKYDFNWLVNDHYSGNDFGHQESRDGDDTQGSYYVHLPDGRLQKVTYYVDGDSGYVAEVSYEGEAQYPESSESREYHAPARPSYSAPESSESREYYAPARPSYSAPESSESREYYAPARPRYFAPESEESYEAPARYYFSPDSNESK